VTLVSVLIGLTLVFMVSSFMLNWVAELRRFRGATSARESRTQNDRIRDADLFDRRQARAAAFRDRMQRERTKRQQETDARTGRASEREPAPPRPAPSSAEARHRATLELGPGPITPDALRRQYRLLMAAYHPDRVSTLGRKLRELAEEETKAINEAHTYFKARLASEPGPAPRAGM
jgi:hypothetical protein